MPIIKQVADFDTIEEVKEFEIDYIKKYKDEYKLVNQTIGGDHPGFAAHSRESIIKKSTTRPVSQYNILGEHIADYEITNDLLEVLGISDCAHITQCCRGSRNQAYGYIWRYKGNPLGDISNLNIRSTCFNKLVQYDLNMNRIAEYDSLIEASEAIGDHSKGGNISSVINGKQKSVKGFIFKLEPIYVYFNQQLFNEKMSIYKKDSSKRKSNCKKVQQFDKNGTLINEYNSLVEASEAIIGTPNGRKSIKECCEGTKENYKGFIWKYRPLENPSNSTNELSKST